MTASVHIVMVGNQSCGPPNFKERKTQRGSKKDEINIPLSMRKVPCAENAQVKNLSDMDNEAQLIDLLNRPRPEVVVGRWAHYLSDEFGTGELASMECLWARGDAR